MALVTFILIFMYVPLLVLILNSFNQSNISSWPIETFSFQWWEFAATYQPIRTALLNSIIVAAGSTVIAAILAPSWPLHSRALISLAREQLISW